MPKLPDLVTGFKMLRQVDLKGVRTQAEKPLHVMVVGEVESDKAALIKQLIDGPRPEDPPGLLPITMHRPDPALQIPDDALVLLLVDLRNACHQGERQLFDRLSASKTATVVCYLAPDGATKEIAALQGLIWPGAETVLISPSNRDVLMRELAPAILRVCKGNEVRLARHLPMIRAAVAQKLVDDACFVNAAYSLGTGLAEIVPVLDLPLNLADIVILTKNQALMAYQITLAMGMKADWRDTMPKLAAVVGSAFLWRQLARFLTGLIPVIGIVPKVAISYAGTYAVGQAVYQWCANGKKLNSQEMKLLYAEAVERGSEVARVLVQKGAAAQSEAADKFAELAQGFSHKAGVAQEQLSVGSSSIVLFVGAKGHEARHVMRSLFEKMISSAPTCAACGKKAPRGACYCAYCGRPITV